MQKTTLLASVSRTPLSLRSLARRVAELSSTDELGIGEAEDYGECDGAILAMIDG